MAYQAAIFLMIIIIAVVHGDNGLQVRLKTKTDKFAATKNVLVSVEFTNTVNTAILMNRPAIPNEELPENLFKVTLNGAPVQYVGPLFKRAPPSIEFTVALGSGQSIRGSVSLSLAYDLSKSGNY